MFWTKNMSHPDEYWQSIEPAYNIVYGGVHLPWEWSADYKLRSTLLPALLAIPLYLLKALGLDTTTAVKLCPMLTHIALVIVSDLYLWRIGKATVGKNQTRIALFFYLTIRQYNEIFIRTFSNSFETIFQLIAFHYFLRVGNKFDRNVVMMVGALTVNFIVRNTSVVGWPVLLAFKVVKDGAFIPFAIAGFTVFLPLMTLSVVMDSLYFGWDSFPVITALNFLKINVGEGLSNYFGTEPVHYFFTFVIPQYFIVAMPFVYLSFVVYLRDTLSKGKQPPYLLIMTFSYLTVYSLIKHKEVRFVLPIIPFCCLMLGHTMHKGLKSQRGYLRFGTKLIIAAFIVVELIMGYIYLNYRMALWQGIKYINDQPTAAHSVYTQRVDTPYYTASHRQRYIGFDG